MGIPFIAAGQNREFLPYNKSSKQTFIEVRKMKWNQLNWKSVPARWKTA